MITLPTRLDIFKLLPNGSLVAEIGVWKGFLSVALLEMPNIDRVWLVDSWVKQTSYPDPLSDDDHEANLAETKHNIRGHLPGGRVKIVRGLSVDVATNDRTIPPLDAFFLDANHSYDAVLADLAAWSNRLKPEGVILGHDFTENSMSKEYNWGVIPAVEKFCADYGWQITHLTDEDFASYRLERLTEWRGAEL